MRAEKRKGTNRQNRMFNMGYIHILYELISILMYKIYGVHRVAQSIFCKDRVCKERKSWKGALRTLHSFGAVNSLCLWFISFDLLRTPVKLNEIDTVGCDMGRCSPK